MNPESIKKAVKSMGQGMRARGRFWQVYGPNGDDCGIVEFDKVKSAGQVARSLSRLFGFEPSEWTVRRLDETTFVFQAQDAA